MNARILSRLILFTIGGALAATSAIAQTGPYQFYAVAPCRVVDTRYPNSTNGGPIMGNTSQRNFAIRGNCGVPTSATAVSLNVTITGATTSSFLTMWPSGGARPNVSTIDFTQNDVALANGAIVGVSTSSSDLSVYNAAGNVHVIIDVTGYFQ
jgi:serine protease